MSGTATVFTKAAQCGGSVWGPLGGMTGEEGRDQIGKSRRVTQSGLERILRPQGATGGSSPGESAVLAFALRPPPTL